MVTHFPQDPVIFALQRRHDVLLLINMEYFKNAMLLPILLLFWRKLFLPVAENR